MSRSLVRLRALIVKEFLAVTRDPRARHQLLLPPVVQLLVFAFAATMDVKRVDVAVLNQDAGHWSRELLQRIEGSPFFRSVTAIDGRMEAEDAILIQKAIAVLQIGPTFSRDIAAGRPAEVQILLDGRKSNAAQIVAGYLDQILLTLAAELRPGAAPPAVTTTVRNWFNPNLIDRWYMVPSLVAAIALLMGLLVTSLSIAREREVGTFDQLMVSPLRTHEILIGKVAPPMLICLVHITLFILTAIYIFGIPLRGSVLPLYGASLVFLFSVVGIGLFISSAASTQQQAILGAFAFMVPAMILSGFVTPVDNMPNWLQPVTYANPMRYFLTIVKGVFLKDMALADIAANTWPMFLIGIVTATLAAWLFRNTVE